MEGGDKDKGMCVGACVLSQAQFQCGIKTLLFVNLTAVLYNNL